MPGAGTSPCSCCSTTRSGTTERAGASAAVRDVLDLIGVTFRRSFDDPSALARLAGLATRVPVLHLGRSSLDEMVAQVEGRGANASAHGQAAGG